MAMRLIDIAPCEHHGHAMVLFATEDGKLCQCRSCDIPTIEAEPVKHGRWILHDNGSGTCDQCRFTQKNVWDDDNQQNYCGVCGAKMDGGDAG